MASCADHFFVAVQRQLDKIAAQLDALGTARVALIALQLSPRAHAVCPDRRTDVILVLPRTDDQQVNAVAFVQLAVADHAIKFSGFSAQQKQMQIAHERGIRLLQACDRRVVDVRLEKLRARTPIIGLEARDELALRGRQPVGMAMLLEAFDHRRELLELDFLFLRLRAETQLVLRLSERVLQPLKRDERVERIGKVQLHRRSLTAALVMAGIMNDFGGIEK